MKELLVSAGALLLMAACSGGNDSGETSRDEIPEYVLSTVDSIGIEMGDSAYVFGAVMDAGILPGGSIAILDGSMCNIRIFSPGGEHIRTISRRGDGPGELINPFNLFLWPDGTIGVIDPYRGGIHRFTPDGQWLGNDLTVTNNSFIDPVVTGDSSFVAAKTRIDIQGDAIYATHFIGLFHMSTEPSVVYHERTVPFDPSNVGNLSLEFFFYSHFTADPSTGRVFVSIFQEDDYAIDVYNPDGTLEGTITAEYDPVPKTEEEILEERNFVSHRVASAEGNNPNMAYDCDPWPNHPAVTGLYVGPDGNLWAARGGTDHLRFDIWNDSLQFMGTGSIPELHGDGSGWRLVFSGTGGLAWNENPENYQQIYILSLRDHSTV